MAVEPGVFCKACLKSHLHGFIELDPSSHGDLIASTIIFHFELRFYCPCVRGSET